MGMKLLFDLSAAESVFLFLQRHSMLVIILTVIITLAFGFLLPGLNFENNPGQLDLPPDDPVRRQLDSFGEQFQAGKVLLVGVEHSRPISATDLQIIRQLTVELGDIEGIQSVHSITNAVGLSWTPTIAVHALRPRLLAVKSRLTTDSAVAQFVSELASHPLYGDNLISRDGLHSACILSVDQSHEHGKRGIKALQQLMTRIREVTTPYEKEGLKFHIAGPVALNVALQSAMRQDLAMFAPISIVAFLLILVLVFRSLKVVLLGVATALFALVWSLGILPLTGTPMSLGLTMLLPIILSMALVYAVHYLACFARHHTTESAATRSMNDCYGHILVPSLLCGITTVVGFLSLGTSPLPGIRDVGIFVGIGILVCVLMANFFLPAAALRIKLPVRLNQDIRRSDPIEQMVERLRSSIMKQPGHFVLAVSVVTVVAGIGLLQLSVETNHLKYLRHNKEITESFTFADQHFGGILPLEILLHVSKDSSAGAVNDMLAAESELRELRGMGSVMSAADLVLEAERTKPSVTVPLIPTFDLARGFLPEQLWQLLERPSVGGAYVIRTDTSLILRIACRTHVSNSRELHMLLSQVDSVAAKDLGSYRPVITGLTRYFTAVERYVVGTQIQSFGLALLVTIVLLSLMAGSWRTSLAVAVVNIIPVILVLGAMGWFGIPLDITTVMIASIAIGIVVDDTLHLLYRYRLELKAGHSAEESLNRAFHEVGKPVTASTIILFAGFISLLPARFVPTAYFGGLSALTILVAAVCDLLLLPALLALLAKHKQSPLLAVKDTRVG